MENKVKHTWSGDANKEFCKFSCHSLVALLFIIFPLSVWNEICISEARSVEYASRSCTTGVQADIEVDNRN